MINFIKNYIDKKFEEREKQLQKELNQTVDEISRLISKNVPKQIERVVENLIGYAKDPLKHRYDIPYPSQKIIRNLSVLIAREYRSQRQEFNNQLNVIKREKNNIPDLVRKLMQREDFIQIVIDEINKKQIKK